MDATESRLLAIEARVMAKEAELAALLNAAAAALQSAWQGPAALSVFLSMAGRFRPATTTGACTAFNDPANPGKCGLASATLKNLAADGTPSDGDTVEFQNWFPAAIPLGSTVYLAECLNDDGTKVWVLPSMYCA